MLVIVLINLTIQIESKIQDLKPLFMHQFHNTLPKNTLYNFFQIVEIPLGN